MKEELVTFKTAKLAKEKGFNIPVKKAYKVYNGYSDMKVNSFKIGKYDHNSLNGNCYNTSAPTQALLQKWLRETYAIDLTVMIRFADSYSVVIHKNRESIKEYTGDTFITKLLRKRDRTLGNYSTKEIIVDPTSKNIKTGVYEEALEKGLQEALKLIKNKKNEKI